MVTVVWIALMLATAVSWWLGTGGATAPGAPQRLATAALLLVAFVKVRLIVMHFMEVGRAPLALRAGFEAWLAVAWLAILLLYVSGPG